MIPKRMIEKKRELITVEKYFYKAWSKQITWEDRQKYWESRGMYRTNVDLNKDPAFLKGLIDLLNEMKCLTKEEKISIAKEGKNWLNKNANKICSVIYYTDEQIEQLTCEEVQSMVAEVFDTAFDNNLCIMKKLYLVKQTETVEALKTQIQNRFLSLSLDVFHKGKWMPDRVVKMMVGKQFCDEMNIGWVKEGENWKTLEQELKEMEG